MLLQKHIEQRSTPPRIKPGVAGRQGEQQLEMWPLEPGCPPQLCDRGQVLHVSVLSTVGNAFYGGSEDLGSTLLRG